MNNIYMVCGPSGSGKSTWIRNNAKRGSVTVSRDKIRFSLLKDGDDYFSVEDEVFTKFIDSIVSALEHKKDVYVDATNLNENSRNKVLSKVKAKYEKFDEVTLNAIYFKAPIELCKKQNAYRTGLAKVPDEVIDKQFEKYKAPTFFEKFKYDHILEVYKINSEIINNMTALKLDISKSRSMEIEKC